MTKQNERLEAYLNHIIQAIERIELYINNLNEPNFMGNLMVQDAVIRNMEVIGEASNNIIKRYPEFVSENSDIPFYFAYQMRNSLAHGYSKIDLNIVWETTQTELPKLHQQINDVLQK